MPTYQQYLDDIQTAVYSQGTADPDLLREAAAEYAEACAQVNQRLREVGHLLHQGLRSEAIQLAEQEPDLMDMVTLLDIAELEEWCALLQNWDMVTPPPLRNDLAAELNEAYAQQKPLESLQKVHRLLALARAPLSGRIAVLHRMRDVDPGNSAWHNELEALEKARIRQLSSEVQQAHQEENLAALESLKREIDDKRWSVPVPQDIVRRTVEMHRAVAKKSARAELGDIETKLTAAYSAFDAPAGLEARAHWQRASATAELLPNDPLAERAAPALEWLAERDLEYDTGFQQAKRTLT